MRLPQKVQFVVFNAAERVSVLTDVRVGLNVGDFPYGYLREILGVGLFDKHELSSHGRLLFAIELSCLA